MKINLQNISENFPSKRVVFSEYNQKGKQYWHVLKLIKPSSASSVSINTWQFLKEIHVSVCFSVLFFIFCFHFKISLRFSNCSSMLLVLCDPSTNYFLQIWFCVLIFENRGMSKQQINITIWMNILPRYNKISEKISPKCAVMTMWATKHKMMIYIF